MGSLTRYVLAGLGLMAAATGVRGQADPIALACPVCHGTPSSDAAHAPSAVPWFYGRPAAEIERQLREFRAGSRAGSAMPRLAHALTDAEIEALARLYGTTSDHAP